MFSKARGKKAQTLAEFAMILSTVLGALFVLMPIIKNAIQTRVSRNFDAGGWERATDKATYASSSSGDSLDTEDVGTATFGRGGKQTSHDDSQLNF